MRKAQEKEISVNSRFLWKGLEDGEQKYYLITTYTGTQMDEEGRPKPGNGSGQKKASLTKQQYEELEKNFAANAKKASTPTGTAKVTTYPLLDYINEVNNKKLTDS